MFLLAVQGQERKEVKVSSHGDIGGLVVVLDHQFLFKKHNLGYQDSQKGGPERSSTVSSVATS